MKLKLLILSVIGIIIYSCSDDDNSNANNFDKLGFNSQIANEIIEPNLSNLVTEAQNFIDCSQEFVDSKDDKSLDELRNCWKTMILQWQSTQFFMIKDLKFSSYEYELAFWPIDTTKIEANLNSTTGISLDKIQEIGSDQKGIFALEYLLFVNDASTLISNPRAIEYITQISVNNLKASQNLQTVWTSSYKSKFIESTDNFVTSTIPTLTNRLIEFTELVKNQKLGYPLGLSKYTEVEPNRLESIYAQFSLELIKENTEILNTVYLGGTSENGLGYDDYLRSFGQKGIELDLKIKAQFAQLKLSQNSIPTPMFSEIVSSKAQYDLLFQEWKTLIILLKTEFIMILDITPTFSDADGD